MFERAMKVARDVLGLAAENEVDEGDLYAVRMGAKYGLDPITISPAFKAWSFLKSDRRTELLMRKSYFAARQHDEKVFDFDGSPCGAGPYYATRTMIGSWSSAPLEVPMAVRRPAMPYRLPRKIVNDFTGMVFGHGRWPSIVTPDDPTTEDFLRALSKAARLPLVFTLARGLGGAVGTAAVSWSFHQGRPRARSHSGENLFVHLWADREDLIPAHVSEIMHYEEDMFDPEKGEVVRTPFWYRFDWTPIANVAFKPVPVNGTEEPEWVIDEEASGVHNDNFAHLIWIQNLPNDEGSNVIDGMPDAADVFEVFDGIDVINSTVFNGAKKAIDPTLVIKSDRDASLVYTGGAHTLTPGEKGDASYLELAGSSLEVGRELVKEWRDQVLETTQCVSPDADSVVAQGASAAALKITYRPMLGKSDLMRTQYGDALTRLLQQMLDSARKLLPEIDEDGNKLYDVGVTDDGEDILIDHFIELEPKIEKTKDENGQEVIKITERVPGNGRFIDLEWGEYFEQTAADRQQETAALGIANGGKPIMSHKTSVEDAATIFGKDPSAEWKAVELEEQARTEREGGMFPSYGDGGLPPVPANDATNDAADPEATDVLEAETAQPDAAAAEPAASEAPAKVADEAMNGAQLASALEIVKATVNKEIPREAAIGLLMVGFRLTREQAENVLGGAGVAFVTETPPAAPPPMAPPMG